MRRHAIFGGTFDPFTEAHLAIVEELFKRDLVESVIIAPTITNWYRDKNDSWLTDDQRVDLCWRAVDKIYHDTGIENVYVYERDIWMKQSLPEGHLRDEFVKNHHFIDTLVQLKTYEFSKSELNDKLYLVIGSDQLESFKKWHRWENVLEMVDLIVVNGRNGKKVQSDIPHIDIEIDNKFCNVSATKIREEYKTLENGFKKYKKLFEVPKKEEILYKTPIFDLVKKPAPFDDKPDFNPIGINSNDFVSTIVEKDNNFMCVRQLRFGLMKEFDEFPCGVVEKDEQPLYAAKRELLEETGIDVGHGVSKFIYLGKYATNPGFMSNYMHYFYVNLDDNDFILKEQNLDENEKLQFFWKEKHKFFKEFEESNGSALMAAALHKLEKYYQKAKF